MVQASSSQSVFKNSKDNLSWGLRPHASPFIWFGQSYSSWVITVYQLGFSLSWTLISAESLSFPLKAVLFLHFIPFRLTTWGQSQVISPLWTLPELIFLLQGRTYLSLTPPSKLARNILMHALCRLLRNITVHSHMKWQRGTQHMGGVR